MSYALIHGMLGVIFQLVWLKQEKKVVQGVEGFELWSSEQEAPTFQLDHNNVCTCVSGISYFIYMYPCFNSNKKGGATGGSNRSHQDKNRAPYQCAKPYFVKALGNKYLYILLFLSQVFAHILAPIYLALCMSDQRSRVTRGAPSMLDTSYFSF